MKTNGGFLVTKIKQLGDRIFEKILSEKNIDAFNGAQGRILYVLWQEDGISIRSLSVKCGLAITSLTTMLEKMENQGLIRRVQSETDKRKTLLFLTEKAHALKDEYDSVSAGCRYAAHDRRGLGQTPPGEKRAGRDPVFDSLQGVCGGRLQRKGCRVSDQAGEQAGL